MGTISPQLEVRTSLLFLVFEADYFAVSVTSSNRILAGVNHLSDTFTSDAESFSTLALQMDNTTAVYYSST